SSNRGEPCPSKKPQSSPAARPRSNGPRGSWSGSPRASASTAASTTATSRGCWRLDWHPHPDHGHPVCLVHHPEGGAEFLEASHHLVKVSTRQPRTSEAHQSTP